MNEWRNTVLLGDNAKILSTLPEDLVDLVVTSPPYDHLRSYQSEFNFELVARELFRILKTGGVIVWIVNDETNNRCESLTSFKQVLYFVENIGFNLHDTMIYKKRNPPPVQHDRYQPCFEFMFILSKGPPKTFNPLCALILFSR